MEQKKEMKWTILKSSAQGLLDCLQCYTKSQLLEIASFYGMDGTRYRKHELVEKLEYEILAQTPAVLKYSSSEDLRGLKLLLSEPDGESTGIWTYQRRGWLFVFGEDGGRKLVVPPEVEAKIARFLSNTKNRETVVRNQEFYRYARALAHLYGVYEKKTADEGVGRVSQHTSQERGNFEIFKILRKSLRGLPCRRALRDLLQNFGYQSLPKPYE